MKFIILLGLLYSVGAEVFFQEKFDDGWKSRWVESTYKGSEQGEWGYSAGKFYNDEKEDMGIKTMQDARFYGISSKFDKEHSSKGKTLVIQFQVKHEQNIDCGGGYVKVFGADLDQPNLHGEAPYKIMFGPDICGYSTKKVHVIFNYKGKNLLTKKEIKCSDDELTHLYTLIVKPDNTYIVKIDNEVVEKGELEADWDFLEPKMIKDPEAKKPEDWVDNEMMDDPEDAKPDDWEKPQYIPDPDAKKPDDWDDEMDGDWEPAMIDNPEYKGEWKPKQIKNPEYKGEWIHPEIENPNYAPDSNLYLQEGLGAIGFDLWQVKAGSIFDNVFVGDDEAEAEAFAKSTFDVMKVGEKAMKEKHDEEERAAAEAEAAKAKAEGAPEPDAEEDMDMDAKDEEEHDHDHEDL